MWLVTAITQNTKKFNRNNIFSSRNIVHQEIQPEQHFQQPKYCIGLLCVEVNEITYKTHIWYTKTFET